MGQKERQSLQKTSYTKKFETNRDGQSGQGQTDTDRIKIYKDADGQERTETDRDGTDTKADSDGQKWTNSVKGRAGT